MQLEEEPGRVTIAQLFQYPLTDRGGCNLNSNNIIIQSDGISVSTNGSRGMQLIATTEVTRAYADFSIH